MLRLFRNINRDNDFQKDLLSVVSLGLAVPRFKNPPLRLQFRDRISLVPSRWDTINQVNASPLGSISLPKSKAGKDNVSSNFLIINTCLYQVFEYFSLIQLNNLSAPISRLGKVALASSLLTETISVWWYTLVRSCIMPETSEKLKIPLLWSSFPTTANFDLVTIFIDSSQLPPSQNMFLISEI